MLLVPYNANVAMPRVPWVNWALIAVTCFVSLWILHGPDDALQERSSALMSLMLARDGSGVGLLSHLFLHADWLHLAGNMVFLFCFGNAVNARLGHVAYVLLYVGSGLAAGAAWLALGHGDFLLGASGAIMGVVGAFAILYPSNRISVFWFVFIRFGTVAIPAWVAIAIYAALDLVGVVVGGGDVAYVAHLGGLAVGGLVALGLIATRLLKPARGEVNLLQLLRGEDGRTLLKRRRNAPRAFGRNTRRVPEPPLPPLELDFEEALPIAPVVRVPRRVALRCRCGSVLRAPVSLRGRRIRCKGCDGVIRVPGETRASAVAIS